MLPTVSLPADFQSLAGSIAYVRQVTSNEFHASCPNCKGTIHEDGSYPDRFVLWIASRRGTPFGLCRKCGYKWSPSKEDAKWSDEEREEFKRKISELEEAYFTQKAAELAVLSEKIYSQKLYEQYHEEALKSRFAMQYYESLGMDESWMKYFSKGFIPDYTVKGHLSTYHSPAYTFPVWTLGGNLENIKVRVASPRDSSDRYRNLYKAGCQSLYVPTRDEKIKNKVVVMEGEKKADCAFMCTNLPDEYQIVGVQSSMPEKRVLKMLEPAEVVYLAFDPDCYKKNEAGVVPVLRTAEQIGKKKCRLVVPPRDTKFDDAMLLGFKFGNAINMAVSAERWSA
jgi:hypothetical protein